MIDLVTFEGPLPYLHLILVLVAAWRLRAHARIDFITLPSWLMMIVFGQHPIFTLAAMLVILTPIVLKTSQSDYPKWPILNKLAGYVVFNFCMLAFLNSNELFLGNAQMRWYGLIIALLLVLLIASPFALTQRDSKKRQPGDRTQSGSERAVAVIIELALSLFLWMMVVLLTWTIPRTEWYYALPALPVLGLSAVWLTLKVSEFRSQRCLPMGLWRYSPSVVTFLWGALAVTVPILGSLLCILLYPRLVQPRDGRQQPAPQPA